MPVLHRLRTTRSLARAALLWWCLALGLAMAAPLAQAHGSRMVCSASGLVMLVDAQSGAPVGQAAHGLDCVLCLAAGAPPAAQISDFSAPTPLDNLISNAGAAAPAWRSAAPPPGRGPPALA